MSKDYYIAEKKINPNTDEITGANREGTGQIIS